MGRKENMNAFYEAMPVEWGKYSDFLNLHSYKTGLSLRVLREYFEVLESIKLVETQRSNRGLEVQKASK